MTKRIALNENERDSHKATLALHLNAASSCIEQGQHGAAIVALNMAMTHANRLNDKAIKGQLFKALNACRTHIRNQTISVEKAVNRFNADNARDEAARPLP